VIAVLFILGFCLAVALAAFLARWSLRPLGEAIRRVNAPTRFALADILWLVILIQVALGASTAIYRGDFEQSSRWQMMSFLLAGAIGIWVGGVSTMSRAGIKDPKRRGIFVLVVLPLVILVMIATIGATLAVPSFLWSVVIAPPIAKGSTILAVGVVIAFALAIFASRRLSGWIVHPAAMTVPEERAED
jgi:hypothetical protein